MWTWNNLCNLYFSSEEKLKNLKINVFFSTEEKKIRRTILYSVYKTACYNFVCAFFSYNMYEVCGKSQGKK
jgi:hypothetical protein